MRQMIFTLFIFILFTSFNNKVGVLPATPEARTAITAASAAEMQTAAPVEALEAETTGQPAPLPSPAPIDNKGSVDPTEFVAFAKGLLGTPYVYGSTNPEVGFDCSGFINHVSSHFGMKVPRSSVQFTNLGIEVPATNAMPGDLILFTGTDPYKRVVGHMGIVTGQPGGRLEFIHSSSGKGKGVVISPLEGYYETRFVKVIRIFPLGEEKIVV